MGRADWEEISHLVSISQSTPIVLGDRNIGPVRACTVVLAELKDSNMELTSFDHTGGSDTQWRSRASERAIHDVCAYARSAGYTDGGPCTPKVAVCGLSAHIARPPCHHRCLSEFGRMGWHHHCCRSFQQSRRKLVFHSDVGRRPGDEQWRRPLPT